MKPLPFLPLALTGCVAVASSEPSWWQETAVEIDATLGGCAVGDIDPRYAGNEIAAVASDGRVLCIRRDGEAWAYEIIAELDGEQIQCAIGDILPRDGSELVTVGVLTGGEEDGGPGVAWVFGHGADGWWRHQLVRDDELLHAVAVGEVDHDSPGHEVVVAGFSGKVHLLVQDGEGHVLTSAEGLSGNAKGAAVGLGGVVIACDDGTLVALDYSAGQLVRGEVLDTYPDALARVSATASSVLVCANDGVLRLRDPQTTQPVFEAPQRLRGAVLADVDPWHPGVEMATAGYDGCVTVLWLEGDEELRVRASRVAQDTDKLHHLAAGDLPGLGTCLVTCGYSGRVTVVGHHPR